MTHPELRERALLRASLTQHLRRFMEDEGLLEVFPPCAVPNPGMEPELGAFGLRAAEALGWERYYLRTSPELAVKASLAALGCDVYALGPVWRDEPPSQRHWPEFTMLEWYRLNASIDTLAADCERLIRRLCHGAAARFGGRDPFRTAYAPFAQVTCREAFLRYAGVDLLVVDLDAWRSAAAERGVDIPKAWDERAAFALLLDSLVEPALCSTGPCFLTHYPASEAALSRLDPRDPRVALRLELYLPTPRGGKALEAANGYDELVDASVQRERFIDALEERRALGRALYPMPDAMLDGLSKLAPSAGIAMGWERVLCWVAETTLGWETEVRDWILPQG